MSKNIPSSIPASYMTQRDLDRQQRANQAAAEANRAWERELARKSQQGKK